MKSIFILTIALVSCTKFKSTELVKAPFQGDEINVNGLFYGPLTSDGDHLCRFLYKDGVIIRGGYATLLDIEEKQKSGSWWDDDFVLPGGILGVFRVHDNKIIIEEYIPRADYSQTQELKGDIKNDSTITIKKIINNLYNTEEDVEIELKFYPFSPKPDSTNAFIK